MVVTRWLPDGARFTLLALAGVLCACSSEVCDPAQLRSQVEGGGVGTEVVVGACRIELSSTLTVPAGVRLRGQGPDASTLVGSGSDVVLVLESDAAGTSLSDLTVVSSSSRPAVYVARGSEQPAITHVRIEASRGIALAGQMVSSLSATDVQLVGPVTAVGLLPTTPTRDTTATHGILFVQVGQVGREALLDQVRLTGFATRGAELVESHVVWRGGDASGNYGVGIMIAGGSGEIEDVSTDGTDGSAVGIIPPYGVVVSGGAEVTTRRVSVSGTHGYGMIFDGAVVHLEDLVVETTDQVGVWAQGQMSTEITGAATSLDGNGGAGLYVVDSMATRVEGASLSSTRLLPRVDGELGRIDVGDGVQALGDAGIMRLAQLRLSGNERVGVLLDLEGGTFAGEISGVMVEGTGTELGAIGQNGTFADAWDDGVTRLGAVLANDAAFTGVLPTIQGSIAIPPTDTTGVDGI